MHASGKMRIVTRYFAAECRSFLRWFAKGKLSQPVRQRYSREGGRPRPAALVTYSAMSALLTFSTRGQYSTCDQIRRFAVLLCLESYTKIRLHEFHEFVTLPGLVVRRE